MKMKIVLAAVIALCAVSPALAYIGPGAGIGAIGTVVAVIGAILLMIIGFVWYPVKRLLKRFKQPVGADDNQK